MPSALLVYVSIIQYPTRSASRRMNAFSVLYMFIVSLVGGSIPLEFFSGFVPHFAGFFFITGLIHFLFSPVYSDLNIPSYYISGVIAVVLSYLVEVLQRSIVYRVFDVVDIYVGVLGILLFIIYTAVFAIFDSVYDE